MRNLLIAAYHFGQAHPAISTAVGYGIFSNLTDLLDEPTATSGKLYKKFYKFMHGIAMNWKTMITPPPSVP